MDLTRRLRTAARAGGHQTTAWDLGQDASFVHGQAIVNVEIKSVGTGPEQYRLGIGQLAEQMQHHLDHIADRSPWYTENGITDVIGVLVVTDTTIDPIWTRLATRLRIAIWTETTASQVFADPICTGLPNAQ